MSQRRLLLFIVFLALFPQSACTVIRYPTRWTGSAPYPTARLTQPPESGERPVVDATPPGSDSPAAPAPVADETVAYLLDFARSLVGSREPLVVNERRFPADCSGFVCALFYRVGEDLLPRHGGGYEDAVSGTEIIFREVQDNGRVFMKNPRAGDLVFFDNTWDRNGDGQLDDEFTHVGVVEQVLGDGTIEIIHLAGAGVGRIHMNLEHPNDYRDDKSGEILNHKLRQRQRSDTLETPYLTAQLFHAFGRLF